jgi:hypothetical protein
VLVGKEEGLVVDRVVHLHKGRKLAQPRPTANVLKPGRFDNYSASKPGTDPPPQAKVNGSASDMIGRCSRRPGLTRCAILDKLNLPNYKE